VSTSKRRWLEVAGIPVEVVRKNIKNLHLGVYPPVGRVRIAAPRRLSREAIRLALVTRLGWIKRQRAAFERQARQSERELATGESHFGWGTHFRLDVVHRDGPPSVEIAGNRTLRVSVRPGTSRDKQDALLDRWYREQLRERLPDLLAKWEPRVGASANEVRLRRMKTRWGSCNQSARRIWLNVELAKKPPNCLEYVLVHELIHLVERRHNGRFLEMMDSLMPSWRLLRAELNRAPLAHEEWQY
jgi:hypothetical protein